MPPSKNISFDELSKFFHLPINQVAKELGVCATILKKICRKNGIPRWPHRKIKSLDKMIANLEVNLSKNPTEREEIHTEVELLKTKKDEIMKNPDILVPKNSSRSNGKHHLGSNMKKSKSHGMYTVSTFKVAELTQVDDEDSMVEESPQNSPSTRKEGGPDFPFPTQHLATNRRPSLPVILDSPTPPSSYPTINLPPPIRRHSMDSLLTAKNALFTSTRHHSSAAVVDFSQELPAFKFPTLTQTPSRLVCIEPQLGNAGLSETFPDWFMQEKNRILGNN